MTPRGCRRFCLVALAGISFPALLLFVLQTALVLCEVKESEASTHALQVLHEPVSKSVPTNDEKAASSEAPTEAGNHPAHPWEATCGSYKSITLQYPQLKARATYDLMLPVDDAPFNGWVCKASEPLFGIDEYPPLFKNLFSILLGDDDSTPEEQKTPRPLHKHKEKHVFFAFNPCRLLPHTCLGSRGRLFKFAAKLEKPYDPEEEINHLLSLFLKLPDKPSEAPGGTPEGPPAKEVLDSTECLQNVLPTNTTLLYAHHGASLQQHPNSNSLGGLWSDPDISDDPTPWEPLDPEDPYQGLQANFRHIHIFCPDSFLHTHVVLKCPRPPALDSTKFTNCEHVDPCHFKMELTTEAACPAVVDYTGKLLPQTQSTSEHSSSASSSKENPHVGAAAGAGAFSSSSGGGTSPALYQQTHNSNGDSAKGQEARWPLSLSFVLVLCIRIALCALIFAWIIYAIRDWTQTKMEYSCLPEEGQSDMAGASGTLNSYDSCVKALAEVTRVGGDAAEGSGRALELATKYTGLPAPFSGDVSGGAVASGPPRKVLRGLYSSPGRRFVSVWLPHTLDAAACRAHAISMGVQNFCRSVFHGYSGRRGAAGEFSSSHFTHDGVQWDWTDSIDCQDLSPGVHDAAEATQATGQTPALSGYETIS
ncbi:uncharacterized protein LOC34619701 [Cyclospora cayetanensis]|uniref:Uncharacterized protein LOC34619701 n=1 Tax=Cyclospora cayetanensis TaxID=88456 RepID=A0A6P6RV86_9EIME|nr:uncharacterized protein LOC34619701 [Cyclospora cayetanensis]